MAKEKLHISILTIGQSKSGKSTAVGHLIYKCGAIDRRGLEILRNKAVKADFFNYGMILKKKSLNEFQTDASLWKFETEKHYVSVKDVPGHRDYIQSMILESSQADCALLVIDARTGEFEAGMSRNNQTREHMLLACTLGVKQVIVCVSKMDSTEPPFSEARYKYIRNEVSTYIKNIGYIEDTVAFLPVSGSNGDNLSEPSNNLSWYKGWKVQQKNGIISGITLLQALDAILPSSKTSLRVSLSLQDVYKSEFTQIYNDLKPPIKMPISSLVNKSEDPFLLVKALDSLLSAKGGIKSVEDIPRLVSLMKQIPKLLLRRWTYCNILQATDSTILSEYLFKGGAATINTWLEYAKSSDSLSFLVEMLKLCLLLPVTLELVKVRNIAKLIKSLTKHEENEVKTLSKRLVFKWKAIIKDKNSLIASGENMEKKLKSEPVKKDKESEEKVSPKVDLESENIFLKSKETKRPSSVKEAKKFDCDDEKIYPESLPPVSKKIKLDKTTTEIFHSKFCLTGLEKEPLLTKNISEKNASADKSVADVKSDLKLSSVKKNLKPETLSQMNVGHPKEVILDFKREEMTRWSITPVLIDIPTPLVERGSKSTEKTVQEMAQKTTLQDIYFTDKMIPNSPKEPDFEIISPYEPTMIPVDKNNLICNPIIYSSKQASSEENVNEDKVMFRIENKTFVIRMEHNSGSDPFIRITEKSCTLSSSTQTFHLKLNLNIAKVILENLPAFYEFHERANKNFAEGILKSQDFLIDDSTFNMDLLKNRHGVVLLITNLGNKQRIRIPAKGIQCLTNALTQVLYKKKTNEDVLGPQKTGRTRITWSK